jgi:hypothetical protein
MPNLIPDWQDWMRPAGRLIWASLLLLIGLAITMALMRRPKPDRPSTWAECMAGSVGVFAMMTLAYAVIPHEWITFADGHLQWGTTRFIVKSGQDFGLFNFPFDITYKAVSDVIAAGIYGVLFGANLALIAMWQKRGKESAPASAEPETRTSRFGRPLRRRRHVDAPITVAGEPTPATGAQA